ncbi:MAG: putative biosynthesis protein capC [Actinomycetota bacterium]|jgi:poly-gamma-glutamate biosynthesis protein PgsC/CapC
MHDYLFSVEIVRFAFIAGVAVSMMLYERLHLTTGSIVVPAYLAVFIVFPSVILATLANAFATYAIVNKLLPRWVLLYGRTKFTLLAMISISFQAIMLKLSPSGPWLWERDVPLVVGVGYVIPALIAHDMGRQGIRKTLKALTISAAVVAAPILVALLAHLPGVNDLSPLEGFGATHLPPPWVPFAVLLSAAASWGIATNYGLRSGGFVGAAFVAMFTADPWQIVLALCAAAATYLIVTKLLMPRAILFGRRKFATMLMLSSLMVWSALWFGSAVLAISVSNHMRVSSLALTPLFLPGLLANDMERTSPRRVLLGMTLASAFVFATTWWARSLVHRIHEPAPIWVTSVALGAFIFWPQISTRPRVHFEALVDRVRERMPQRPVPALTLGSFYAQPLVAATAASAWSNHGYQVWRESHREEAVDAERWLESQLTNHARVLERFHRFEHERDGMSSRPELAVAAF